jgi:hypothetical protein
MRSRRFAVYNDRGSRGRARLEIADGQITSISAIINSDKTVHLGPVADFTALLKSAR